MKEITAFPFVASDDTGMIINTGMTLRDYFAAQAMQSMNSRPDYDDVPAVVIAADAYTLADAMMKVREA
jgi:hypothetical protein